MKMGFKIQWKYHKKNVSIFKKPEGRGILIGIDDTCCGDAILGMHHYTPPATKLGVYTGITMSVRPSVCPAAFGFPAHNCFPFTPIIMKLHMQTPHESRMCPIDFKVKGQGHNA